MTEEQFKLIYNELREINRKLDYRNSIPSSLISTSQYVCQHEYPNPWHGTVGPYCKKCGKQAPSYSPTYIS